MPRQTLIIVFSLSLFAAFLGCNEDATTTQDTATAQDSQQASMVPDFQLADVNPNSASFEQTISPRNYLGKVSAWYFTHAT